MAVRCARYREGGDLIAVSATVKVMVKAPLSFCRQ